MDFLPPIYLIATKFFHICCIFFTVTHTIYAQAAESQYKANQQQLSPEQIKISEKIQKFFSSTTSYYKFLEPKTEILSSDAKRLKLSDFRGNFLIVSFWATWCNDCYNILQDLEKFQKSLEYRNIKDVLILPISIDFKKPTDVVKLAALKKISLPIYFDPSKTLFANFNVKNIPMIFFINKKGEVIYGFHENVDWNNSLFIQKFIELKNSSELSESSASGAETITEQKDDDPKPEDGIITTRKSRNITIIN